MNKRFLTVLLVAVLFFSLLPSYSCASGEQITVICNGAKINFDTPPILKDSRVLVPLRAIAEALNVQIAWTAETRSISYFSNNGVAYYLVVGHDIVEIGRAAGVEPTQITIDVPPIIVDGRTLVPIRFIAESFDANVNWDGNTRTVTITTQEANNANNMAENIHTLYDIPGTGEYEGFRQLKGFPEENILEVFFQTHRSEHFEGSLNIRYKTRYIGKYANDLKKTVAWTDQLGLVHITTIGKLFSIQTDLGSNAIKKMETMYGDMYDEWFELHTINYVRYVDKYLVANGEKAETSALGWAWDTHAQNRSGNVVYQDIVDNSADATIKAYRNQISDEWFNLLIESTGYITDEWISDAKMPLGLSCALSLDEPFVWEFFKNYKVIYRFVMPVGTLEGKEVTVDGIRATLVGLRIYFNVSDLVKAGLIEESKVRLLPERTSYINERVFEYIVENYPDTNPDEYMIKDSSLDSTIDSGVNSGI